MGLLFKVKPFSSKKSLLALYHSYIGNSVNQCCLRKHLHDRSETNKQTGKKNMLFASYLIKECLSTQDIRPNKILNVFQLKDFK